MKNTFIIFSFMLLLLSCNNKKEELPILNVIEAISNKVDMNISDIATRVTLVPLETNENILIGRISKVLIDDKYIIISHDNQCSLFDRNGKFLNKIGNRGEGPEEYAYINAVIFDNKNIIVCSFPQMKKYKLDGTFISSFRTPARNFDNIAQLDENLYVGFTANFSGAEKTRFIFFDDQEQVDSIVNTQTYNGSGVIVRYYDEGMFFERDEKMFFKEYLNDTVYSISKDMKLSPVYTLYLGDFKPDPLERYQLKNPMDSPFRGKYLVSHLFDTPRYLLFNGKDDRVIYWDKKENITANVTLKLDTKEKEFLNTEKFVPKGVVCNGRMLMSFEPSPNEDDNPILVLAELKE